MTKEQQMLNALKSVEIFLKNQDLSEIGMQVKGKVVEAINRAEGNGRKCKCETPVSDIEDSSMCGNCGDDISIVSKYTYLCNDNDVFINVIMRDNDIDELRIGLWERNDDLIGFKYSDEIVVGYDDIKTAIKLAIESISV